MDRKDIELGEHLVRTMILEWQTKQHLKSPTEFQLEQLMGAAYQAGFKNAEAATLNTEDTFLEVSRKQGW